MEFISAWTAPTVLELVGILFLLYWLLYRLGKLKLHWMLNNCGAVAKSRKILTPGVDDYAVVTGASDGIGLEYARQLAARGYNLLLLSRTEAKLKRVADELSLMYSQAKKIEILAVDFSRNDIYDRVKTKIESLDGPIHVLVNNVGMLHHIPEYFTRYPEGHHLQLINTNVVSMTMMSEIVLRIMEKQTVDPKYRKSPVKGVVINLSSGMALSEYPMFSTYSASKVYVNYLSKILATEYSGDKILIQTVTPNQVDTNMTKDAKDKNLVVKAKDFVRYALQAVGSEQQTSGHPRHKFINNLSGIMEGLLGESIAMKLKFNLTKQNRSNYEQKVAPVPETVTTSQDAQTKRQNNN